MSALTTIRRISYQDILGSPNAQALIDEYGAECSIPLIGKINQQPETYRMLEQSGMMHCFGVFDADRLVGFASVLTSVIPHYGQKVATVESLFVSSGHRSGGTGRALMATIEAHASTEGCVAILYSAPAHSQFEQLLTLYPVYTRTNSVFCRRLT